MISAFHLIVTAHDSNVELRVQYHVRRSPFAFPPARLDRFSSEVTGRGFCAVPWRAAVGYRRGEVAFTDYDAFAFYYDMRAKNTTAVCLREI